MVFVYRLQLGKVSLSIWIVLESSRFFPSAESIWNTSLWTRFTPHWTRLIHTQLNLQAYWGNCGSQGVSITFWLAHKGTNEDYILFLVSVQTFLGCVAAIKICSYLQILLNFAFFSDLGL